MTVSEVKRDLPDVPVKLGKRRFMAKVSGRQCPYACVTLSYIHHGKRKGYLRDFAAMPWIDVHFSWEAVARAVTTGEPLDFAS